MTKPGTTRWNVVVSKNPSLASATSDAAVFGAVFGSSSIVNEPQFVETTRLYVFAGSSGSSGGSLPPSGFGTGSPTGSQPPAAPVSVSPVSGAASGVGASGVRVAWG